MVTLDAIHCCRETCHETVENAGGHYLVGVKENQKALLRRIQAVFESGEEADRHRCTEKGHGRRETRAVTTAAVDKSLGLPNARTAIRVHRRRETVREGKVVGSEEETAFAVTSLPVQSLSAEKAAHLVRGHWGIENRLHHVKDASLLEDRCRANNGLGRILAALRSIAVLVLRNLPTTTVVAMRRLAGNPHKATAFLTCKSLTEFRLCFLK